MTTQPSLSSESMVHWDPRNDAERPNMLRGKASKSVVSTILSNRKSAQRGTITSFMGVKTENELKRETSLDKVAVPGPSGIILYTISPIYIYINHFFNFSS
jgi:hypothetical protein